jgi:hypothetical protein
MSQSSLRLVHRQVTLEVPGVRAITKCYLFQRDVTLAAAPYRVKSSVTLSVFREFVSALEGKDVKITDANFAGLQQLCEEFGFSDFSAKLSEFRRSIDPEEASGGQKRIAALGEKAKQHNCDIEVLQS